MQVQTKILEDLYNAGAHLGHKTNRIHPKARKFIYKIDNGTSIIDLTKTSELLDKAKHFISEYAKEGKTLLVVCTKKIVMQKIAEICQENSLPNITLKWPAGLLTNFETIIKNIHKMKEMKKSKLSGEWEKFVKHEQVMLDKHLKKLERIYGGLEIMEKRPDAVFIVDIKKEKNALIESQKMNIPVVAVVDTNVNPENVDFPIPGNDDAENSILYFINQIIEAYKGAKKELND